MPPRRPNKYAARRTTVAGVTYDSAAEARRGRDLELMERAGLIRDLRRQVSHALWCGGIPILIRSAGYPNGRQARYVVDFQYTDVEAGEIVLEDVKGMDTPVSRLKRAILEAMTGLQVRVTR